jgi:hypothetical protein
MPNSGNARPGSPDLTNEHQHSLGDIMARTALVVAGMSVLVALLSACGEKTPSAPSAPTVASYGDGTYTVGKDIKASLYRTAGPAVAGGTCSTTLTYGIEVDGTVAESIYNTGDPKANYTVTIRPNDLTFETQGCAPWVDQLSGSAPAPRTARVTSATSEATYLITVRQQGIGTADDERELRRAKAMCGSFDRGSTREALVGGLRANNFNQSQALYLLGAATAAFCPQHQAKVIGN